MLCLVCIIPTLRDNGGAPRSRLVQITLSLTPVPADVPSRVSRS